MFIHLGIAFSLDYAGKSLGLTDRGFCAIIYFMVLATLYVQKERDYTRATSLMLISYATDPKGFIDFMNKETQEIKSLLNNTKKEEN